MEQLERVWELITVGVNGVLGKFERTVTSLFGSANARYIRQLGPKVAAINALEARYELVVPRVMSALATALDEQYGVSLLRLGHRPPPGLYVLSA